MSATPVAEELSKEQRLYRIRHGLAHVMAQAVLEMFPEGKIAIGPPIENGFYYDFDLPRALTDADLKSMKEELYRVISHYFTVTPDNLEIEVLTRDGRAALSVNTPVEFPAR